MIYIAISQNQVKLYKLDYTINYTSELEVSVFVILIRFFSFSWKKLPFAHLLKFISSKYSQFWSRRVFTSSFLGTSCARQEHMVCCGNLPTGLMISGMERVSPMRMVSSGNMWPLRSKWGMSVSHLGLEGFLTPQLVGLVWSFPHPSLVDEEAAVSLHFCICKCVIYSSSLNK